MAHPRIRLIAGASLAAALIGAGAGVPRLERGLTFHPAAALRMEPRDLGLASEDVALRTIDGQTLSGWYLPRTDPIATVIFFHGNAGNMGDRLPDAAALGMEGFSVLLIDYRGYGRSSGAPSEEGIYADARAAWRYLVKDRSLPPGKIALLGESLGSAAALHLALDLKASREAGPGAIVVVGAFTSAQDMARRLFPWLPVRWMLHERLDNLAAVQEIDTPLLIVHGQDDDIAPAEMGRRLFAASASPVKRLLELPAVGHAALMTGGRPLSREIARFVRGARSEAPANPGPR